MSSPDRGWTMPLAAIPAVFPLAMISILSCASTHPSFIERARSPQFRDGKFHNTAELESKGMWDAIKMRLSTDWADWPEQAKTTVDTAPVGRVDGDEVRVTFINHATMLIQSNSYNILTDPVYAERSSPFSFAGPKRVHGPGIAFENLPKIDVVIISHDHYDHLDTETIAKLAARDAPKIFVGLGVGERLDETERVIEMDWWEKHDVAEDFVVHFVEVQHFSGRGLSDWFSTLWGGYVLEIGTKKIYFGGDSGYGEHYNKTHQKFGPMDLSFLPIGAYAPRDFMWPAHMDPAQSVKAHLDLRSKKSIGMHYGCFQLTAEPLGEPVELLKSEAKRAGLKDEEFTVLQVGTPEHL